MLIKINRKYAIGIVHVLVWVAIILIPPLFSRSTQDRPLLGKEIYLWLIVIAFFYLNYYILVPRLLIKNRIAIYALALLVVLAVSYGSTMLIISKSEIRKEIMNSKETATAR